MLFMGVVKEKSVAAEKLEVALVRAPIDIRASREAARLSLLNPFETEIHRNPLLIKRLSFVTDCARVCNRQ